MVGSVLVLPSLTSLVTQNYNLHYSLSAVAVSLVLLLAVVSRQSSLLNLLLIYLSLFNILCSIGG